MRRTIIRYMHFQLRNRLFLLTEDSFMFQFGNQRGLQDFSFDYNFKKEG